MACKSVAICMHQCDQATASNTSLHRLAPQGGLMNLQHGRLTVLPIHPSSCFRRLQRQRLREMRQQRKAEARAVAAVVDADALAEQEAKALELQVRGMMSWCVQHPPTLVPSHELLQCNASSNSPPFCGLLWGPA